MVTVNPKKVIREWLEEKWKQYVRRPIEKKTEQIEKQVSQQFNTYSSQAKEKISTCGIRPKKPLINQ